MAKKEKKERPKKKFVVIGKVGTNPQGGAVCYKHWTNNIEYYLLKTATKYDFFWINFYYNTREYKGDQFASWSRNKGFYINIRTSKK